MKKGAKEIIQRATAGGGASFLSIFGTFAAVHGVRMMLGQPDGRCILEACCKSINKAVGKQGEMAPREVAKILYRHRDTAPAAR